MQSDQFTHTWKLCADESCVRLWGRRCINVVQYAALLLKVVSCSLWAECGVTIVVGTDINSLQLLVRAYWAGIKSQFFCLRRACVAPPQAILFPPSYITLPCWGTENYVLTQFSFVLHFRNRLWVHWWYNVDHIRCGESSLLPAYWCTDSHWKYVLLPCELNLLNPTRSYSSWAHTDVF